ncbi:MAG: hypothetical protein GY950_16770, partial [bacterium]|nr:hypothetical protein [bacterium]
VGTGIIGVFKNREKVLIKDLNLDGMQVIAGFSPIIGSRYTLTVTGKEQVEDFDIQVVRVDAGGYNSDEKGIMPVGVVYSIGARILNLTENKKEFLMGLLYT